MIGLFSVFYLRIAVMRKINTLFFLFILGAFMKMYLAYVTTTILVNRTIINMS